MSHLEDLKKKSEESWESYKKQQWGKVPQYLVDRKEAWKKAEEERIKNIPDPDCPPGKRQENFAIQLLIMTVY